MPHTAQAGRHHPHTFAGLMYITVCTYATLYAPQPLLSSIHAEYSMLSGAVISLIMTVVLAPLSIAPLIYGSFLGSVRAKHVLALCLCLLLIGSLGAFFSSDYTVLLFFRFLQGLAIPAVLTCIMAYISSRFRGERLQRALAFYVGINILGSTCGRLLAGVIASFGGWRSAFLILAAALLLAFYPVFLMKKEDKAHFHAVAFHEFLDILRLPTVKTLLLIDICGFFVFSAIAHCLPFYLSEHGTVGEFRIAMLYIGYAVGFFIAFASPRIIHFLGSEVRTILTGVCLYLLVLPLFLSHNTFLLFIAMTLVCTGQFLEHSVAPGLINRVTSGQDKGAVNGLYLSLYYFGGALSSFLSVFLYMMLGWQMVLGILACVLCISISLTWRLQRQMHPNLLK